MYEVQDGNASILLQPSYFWDTYQVVLLQERTVVSITVRFEVLMLVSMKIMSSGTQRCVV
jgi:hypothetical protein